MAIGIYRILNTKTGRSYIESSIQVECRIKNHKQLLARGSHQNQKLQRSWDKHGDLVWEFSVVELCTTVDLLVREQHWIDFLNTCTNGYNIAPFADHHQHSEETRRKIGAANSRRSRELLSAIGKKIGEANRNRSPELKEQVAQTFRGKTLSEAHKAKISAGGKGKRRSQETRERMREAALKREATRRLDPEKRAEFGRLVSRGKKSGR